MTLKVLLLGKKLSHDAQAEQPDIKKIVRSVKNKNHKFLSGSLAKFYSEVDQEQDTKNINLNSDQSLLLIAENGSKLYNGLKSVDDEVTFVVSDGEQIVARAGRYSSEGAGGDDQVASGGVFLHVGPRYLVKKSDGRITLQGNNLLLSAVATVVRVMRGKQILD